MGRCNCGGLADYNGAEQGIQRNEDGVVRTGRGRRERGQHEGHETDERDQPAFVKHVSAWFLLYAGRRGSASSGRSHLDTRILLVRRSHPAQVLECFREQLIQ